MVSADDFVTTEYTDDLTAAGISVCRARLSRLGSRGRERVHLRLRRQVASVAVALALRRYLSQQGIEYTAAPSDSFNDGEIRLLVGGARWHINSYLISRTEQVAALEADSGLALTAAARIPVEYRWRQSVSDDDVHVFALCTGVFGATGVQRGSASGLPAREFRVHLMPSGWAQPKHWVRMGPVTLKSASPEETILELGGHNEAGQFLTQQVQLVSGLRRQVATDFCSLTHIHARSRPNARLGIKRESGRRAYVIDPDDWADLWIHGSKILFLGWIRHHEFRHRAKTIPAGSRVFQFSLTRTANMSVPVEDLKPLARLIGAQTRAPAGR